MASKLPLSYRLRMAWAVHHPDIVAATFPALAVGAFAADYATQPQGFARFFAMACASLAREAGAWMQAPEHVALFGMGFCWIVAPLLALALAFTPGPTRWVNRAIAAVLLILWAPLVYAAPQILSALL